MPITTTGVVVVSEESVCAATRTRATSRRKGTLRDANTLLTFRWGGQNEIANVTRAGHNLAPLILDLFSFSLD
jgi:hypothetical protein